MSIIYYVMNEHTLGYLDKNKEPMMGVLATKINGPHVRNGTVHFDASRDDMRFALPRDFKKYGVELPADYTDLRKKF